MTQVCSCFCGSSPEPASVVVNNNTFNVSLGTGVEWVVDTFTKAQSSSGVGTVFSLSRQPVQVEELQVFYGSVFQEPATAYTLNELLLTLPSPLEDGINLVVRYLANIPAA